MGSDSATNRIRLVATDLDGTLLRSDATISCRTRAALEAAELAGLTILSITARPPRRIRQIAAATGLRGLAICSNGAVVYDLATDVVLEQHRLAPQRGIVREQVVAFGDMPNDLAMLSWAGRAVAVANAHVEVLRVAHEVTASNDEDGVAQTLEQLAARGYARP